MAQTSTPITNLNQSSDNDSSLVQEILNELDTNNQPQNQPNQQIEQQIDQQIDQMELPLDSEVNYDDNVNVTKGKKVYNEIRDPLMVFVLFLLVNILPLKSLIHWP